MIKVMSKCCSSLVFDALSINPLQILILLWASLSFKVLQYSSEPPSQCDCCSQKFSCSLQPPPCKLLTPLKPLTQTHKGLLNSQDSNLIAVVKLLKVFILTILLSPNTFSHFFKVISSIDKVWQYSLCWCK